MAAAQAIAEPLAQGSLGAKHSGGAVSGAADREVEMSGFKYINQLIQVPKTFKHASTIAETDGRIGEVTPAPQGGWYVKIGNHEHYVDPESDVTVKVGQKVEAGDPLSTGIPNPSAIVEHKGIGEGRRRFVDVFRKALSDSKIPAHRRNIELLARGFINHVRMNNVDDELDYLPDDVVPYDHIAANYRPRQEAKSVAPIERSVCTWSGPPYTTASARGYQFHGR
jgi:hypothetical protein